MCGNELRGDCEQEAVHERKPPLMCRHEHEQAAALKRIALSLGRMGRQFHDLGTLPHWQPPNSLNFFFGRFAWVSNKIRTRSASALFVRWPSASGTRFCCCRIPVRRGVGGVRPMDAMFDFSRDAPLSPLCLYRPPGYSLQGEELEK